MRLLCYLRVPLFQLLNQVKDFHETSYNHYFIKELPKAALFNFLFSNNNTNLWGGMAVLTFHFGPWKRDFFLGTWNVRSLYRAGSFTAAAIELARYKLHLVGVQEVRWDNGAQ